MGSPKTTNPIETIQNLLRDIDTYGTTLLVLCLDRFGTDLVQWHPETVALEIRDEFGVDYAQRDARSRDNLDKLLAALSVISTDWHQSLARFLPLACTLAGETFDPSSVMLPTATECAWALTEMLLLDPPEPDEANDYICEDIRAYIGHVLYDEGFITPPDILRIAIDADWTKHVSSFSDDPELFSGIWANQKQKTTDVESTLSEGLFSLMRQLRELPLKNGNVQEIEKRLATMLRHHADTQADQAEMKPVE